MGAAVMVRDRFIRFLAVVTAAILAAPASAADPTVMAVIAPSGPDVTTASSGWVAVPQMRANVTIREASDLSMGFCAETGVTNAKRMFVRALLDGQPAAPSDVVFAVGWGLGTNCFNFVKKNVSAGPHVVLLQWRVDSGGEAHLGDRTFQVIAGALSSNELGIIVATAPSGPNQVVTGGWQDIPNMVVNLALGVPGDLTITLSAETLTTNNRRLFVRALVDGLPAAPSDQVFAIGGLIGTRTISFVMPNASQGSHNVRLQWSVDNGGNAQLGDRTLTVVASRSSSVSRASGVVVAVPSGPAQTTKSTSWINVPGLTGMFVVADGGDLVVNVSAELWANGTNRVFLRSLVDGRPTNPGDALVATGGSGDTYAFSFVRRGVSRGSHSVTVQWRTDPNGEASIGDRALSVLAGPEYTQAAWTVLPGMTTSAGPAMAAHWLSNQDARVYVAAVADNGVMSYTSTRAPGQWSEWTAFTATPQGSRNNQAFVAHPTATPALIRVYDTLFLFVRGKDDNLYEIHKLRSNSWSNWQQLTDDAPIRGRISVVPVNVGGGAEFHVGYVGDGEVGYRRYRRSGSAWQQVGQVTNWTSGVEIVLGAAESNAIWAIIRTGAGTLQIMKQDLSPTSGWDLISTRQPNIPPGGFHDISNAISFQGQVHFLYAEETRCDDVGTSACFRIRDAELPSQKTRTLGSYVPEGGRHPLLSLIAYRNKLVAAYTDPKGVIRYSRWDNADGVNQPWVGGDAIDARRQTHHRPALALFNRRWGCDLARSEPRPEDFERANFGCPALQQAEYSLDNFGNDLFSAVNDVKTHLVRYINLSRSIAVNEISKEIAVYDAHSNGCRYQYDPDKPTLISDISQDGRPFLTELGYLLWTLPNWLVTDTIKGGAKKGCEMGNTSGRFDPPCALLKYPVLVQKSGPLNICSGAWQRETDHYGQIWEEIGHSMAGSFGLFDKDAAHPNQDNEAMTGIPLSALEEADHIFGQALNDDCNPNQSNDTCPNQRTPGFTRNDNYDKSDLQHSFIYPVYSYFFNGNNFRALVDQDLRSGSTLLRQKYDWIKENMYQGVEFSKENEVWRSP
jgi:hypothetical protein